MYRLALALAALLTLVTDAAAAEPTANFRIQLDTVTKGYDGKYCWTQARPGAIPRRGQPPIVVITMQRLLVTGSDVYYAINDMRSDDLGKTWSGPVEHDDTLGRRKEAGGIEVVPCDFWPKWHAKSGKLLGTGHTVRYNSDKGPMRERRRETPYSVYDPATRTWSSWDVLQVPPGELAYNSGAGCTQRLDLPNGDILLPVYFKAEKIPFEHVMVLRCGFDGRKLTLLEQGNKLSRNTKRGFAEPSLTRFQGKFCLTIRHDDASYVATSNDGLHFDEPRQWLWDDGTELGSYNTQTHWVTHSDALFLVYTRRGANNDHVFRHRAPLFIAEVNPKTLRVLRATERVLLPEKGARYGNFGVCDVSERETWVVDTEWMQKPGPDIIIPVNNKWGAEGRVYAARIIWEKPNKDWDKR
ncbi:MAG TPA: sialidase family protein [Verrucomicrobiae bacterium]